MRRHPLAATTAGLIATGLVATACGGGSTGSTGGRPTIAVTTSVLGDVVRHLTGDLAEVEVVMPAGVDPHEFQPSAREAAALREADVVVANGAGFEEGLADTIDGAEDDGAVVFAAMDHVDPLEIGATGASAADAHAEGDDDADEGVAHAEGDGHDHDGADPHFFTDPSRMADAAEALAGVLAEEVPALDDAAFRERAAAYVAELRALDGEVDATLAAVPAERRKLVTDHEVFGYFADRYGFEVVGTVIPSATSQAAPSAGDLDALATAIADADVPAVFTDTSAPEELADTLADEVGDIAVVELHSESLGGEGSGAETYVEMVRTNATRIADALAP